jgi:hypothetical protein
MFENLTFKNIVIGVIVLFVLYYIYNNYFSENFANSQEYPHEIWGVNAGNQIYKAPIPCVNGNSCQWQQMWGPIGPDGNGMGMKNISQGDFDLYGVAANPNEKGNVYRCAKPCNGGKEWTQVPGTLKQVSHGKDSVWGVADDNSIWFCPNSKAAPCTGNWKQTNGQLAGIDAV